MLNFSNSQWKVRFLERWENLKLAFDIFWNCNPRTAKWVILITVLEGLLPLALVYATQFIVNTYNQTANFTAWLTGPALVYIGLISIKYVTTLFGNWLTIYHENSLSDYLDSAIQKKAAEADMIAFESSDFHDRLYRAGFESEDHVIEIVEKLIFLISGGTTLIGLFWVVSRFEWWLPLLFCAASLPLFATLIFHANSKYKWSKSMTQTQRKSSYFNWLLLGDEAAGEIRIFGLKDFFGKQYRELRKEILHSKLKLHKQQSLRATGANLVSVILLSLGVIFIVEKLRSGEISTGSAALFAHASLLCFSSVKSMVGESANLYRSTLFLTDLGFVLGMKPKITAPDKEIQIPVPVQTDIKFEKVVFHYPDSTQPALNGVDLTIPSQKITLLYGENGSGKSTLSKLICRFFDPDEGVVKLGGKDIKSFDPKDLRATMGVVFQDPVRYYFTAKKNITLGDVDRPFSQKEFNDSVNQAQINEILSDLPEAENSNLGRWFQDGTQLSCGQWQRLALGRLIYSNRPVMILDEPTSAMDPWTEQKWLNSLKESAKGKTVLIITHRISTAAIADHVIVLKDGKVAESGSPQELEKKCGSFANLKKNNRDL